MYQALYRKWRPKTFDEVVGQDHITGILKNQVLSGRLSHAYLFIGTRGTGKTSCAKILAKAVNCHNPVSGNPCNICPSCTGIDDGSVMDIVEMDAASNNGVDNVRALRDEAVFSPATSKKRVYIIDEVHMLSTSAFNALLKILEEPPAHLMFILATTELHKVPATILSRCQRHSFKRLDPESIKSRLHFVAQNESIKLTDDAASLIARLSDGGMRDALSLLDQCSGRELIDPETVYTALGLAGMRNTVKLLDHVCQKETEKALILFQELWQGGKDPGILLEELSTLLRDVLMGKIAPKNGASLQSGSFEESDVLRFSERLSAPALIFQLETIQKTLSDMRGGQAKTLCELCLISICEPEDTSSLSLRVEALEQKLESGAFTPAAPERTARQVIESHVEDTASAEEMKLPVDEIPFDVPPLQLQQKSTPVEVEVVLTETGGVPKNEADEDESELSSDDSDAWTQIKTAVNGEIPIGISSILTDDAQASGELRDDKLYLSLKTDFARNMVGKADVIAKLSVAAKKIVGREIQIVTTTGSNKNEKKTEERDKLDSLRKFDIVTFN